MNIPRIPSFFKARRPNQFEFQPRYYSEQKEKMDERRGRIARELEASNKTQHNKEQFRSQLRENWGEARHKKTGYSMNYRIIFYILILVGVAYFLLK